MGTSQVPEFEHSESLKRSAATPQASQSQGQPLQASGSPPEVKVLAYSEFAEHVAKLIAFTDQVAGFVSDAVAQKVAGTWSQSDDDLFLPHTALLQVVLGLPPEQRARFALIPAHLWAQKLLPITTAAEAQLRKSNAAARIHKGAPFFNVGLSFFLAGDFDRSFQYFTEAGTEDELSGRGSKYLVPIGVNPLAEKAIIRPLGRNLVPPWQREFQRVTSISLDDKELQSLLLWLVQRAPDAFQTVIALHRLRFLADGLENEATRYQMVRALADIVLAVESSLRRWQTGATGQLHDRADHLLRANPNARVAFLTFHQDFTNRWTGPQRETGAAVNWVVSQTNTRLAASTTVAERLGIACYLAVRLRNSLMHVNEETLDIHNNRQLCLHVAGLLFAVLRISKHGDENTLPGL